VAKRFSYTNIGVSTNLFNNPRDVVGLVRRLGLDFPVVEVEIENGVRKLLNESPSIYEATVEELNEIRVQQGLYLSVHAPYIGADCDLSAEDEEVRQSSCNLLRKAIQFCADIGGERLTYHPGYISNLSVERMIENLTRSLLELVPEAGDKGVKLCLENTGADRPTYLVFSPEQHALLSEKTGTRLTVDLIHHASLHSNEQGEISYQFFDELMVMMPHIENIHIADMNIPKHVHLPIGQGNLPVTQLLDFLSHQNYQGNAIIEEIGGGFSSEEFLKSAVKFRANYCEPVLV
jgi:sugar phosphate isomerase/epimerase